MFKMMLVTQNHKTFFGKTCKNFRKYEKYMIFFAIAKKGLYWKVQIDIIANIKHIKPIIKVGNTEGG